MFEGWGHRGASDDLPSDEFGLTLGALGVGKSQGWEDRERNFIDRAQ